MNKIVEKCKQLGKQMENKSIPPLQINIPTPIIIKEKNCWHCNCYHCKCWSYRVRFCKYCGAAKYAGHYCYSYIDYRYDTNIFNGINTTVSHTY